MARLAAGAFGGPATALGYAIIADVVPPSAAVARWAWCSGAFSVSSVLGVPLGLELARLAGWRARMFFAIALLTALATLLARFVLPPLTSTSGAAWSMRTRPRSAPS